MFVFRSSMASSTVARRRPEPASCLKDPEPTATSDNSDSEEDKDLCLEDFEIIKTIGKNIRTSLAPRELYG